MKKKLVARTDRSRTLPRRSGAESVRTKKGGAEKRKGSVSIHLYDEAMYHISVRRVNICAKQILGSRKTQQDSYAASPSVADVMQEKQRAWAVVCDGMGGMSSGELASKTAVDIVSQVLSMATRDDDIPSVLKQAIVISNEAVQAISEDEGAQSGTTLVSAVIEGNMLYYASVGDSRIYICRGEEFLQITRDHNYMLELKKKVDEGIISMNEAMADPQKDALISFIGIDELELADITGPVELKSGDVILLCSDGLTKAMSDNEIYYYIKNSGDACKIVDTLLEETQSRSLNGLDNTTVAVIEYVQN